MAVELASAYVTLIPSARGIKAQIESELRPLETVARTSGEASGSAWSRAFGSNLDQTGQRMSKFGLAAVGAASAAAFGLVKLAGAAGDLNATIAANEQVLGEASQATQDWADDSVRAVGLSKQAAIEATTQFGGIAKAAALPGPEVAKFAIQMTEAAADMAAFKNVSPEEALQAIQAGFAGSTEVLRPYNIFLDDATLKTAFFRETGEKVSGTLSAQQRIIATHSEIVRQGADMWGQWNREIDSNEAKAAMLRASLENLAAAVGQGVAPALSKVLDVANGIVGAFNGMSPEAQETAGTLAVVATAALGLVGALSFVGGQAIKFRDRFRGVDGDLNKLGKTAKATSLALGAFAVTEVVFAGLNEISDAAGDTERALQGLVIATEQGSSEIVSAFDRLAKSEGDTLRLSNLWRDFGKEIRLAGSDSKRNIEELDDAFGKLLDTGPAQAQAFIDALTEQTDALDHNSGQYRDNIDLIERWSGRLDLATGSAEVLADSTGKATTETQGLANVAADSIDIISDVDTALAEAAGQADAFSEALDRLIGTQIGLDAAGDAAREGAVALGEAFTANGATLDANTEAGRANRDAIREQAQAILEYGNASLEAGGSVDEAAASVNYLTAGLRQQLIDVGLTEQQVDEYIRTLGLTPDNVTTALRLANEEQAKAGIEDHLANLGQIPEHEATEIQALIDEGAWAEVQRRIRELEDRKIRLQAQIDLRGSGFKGVGYVPETATGGYFTTPQVRSLAEDYQPEAVLTLGKPDRLRALLADPRISLPIIDALAMSNPSGMGGGPMVQTGDIYLADTSPRRLTDELDRMLWSARVGATT